MKEIVRKIFGDDAANDKDIVDMYEEIQFTVMMDFAKTYHKKELIKKDNCKHQSVILVRNAFQCDQCDKLISK